MEGIVSYGGYIPRLRLQLKSILNAMGFFNPGISGAAKGERSMCNWDEDALTMAVAAARDCLVATRRRHVDDTDLKVEGDITKEWLLIANPMLGSEARGKGQGSFPRRVRVLY